jgi:transaldolase / glucose-6-phosphate isomerase
MNPLQALQNYGQSVWLDYIRRNLLTSGELQRLLVEDGLRGMTSNPAIFEKAIAGSTDYNESLKSLELEADLDAMALYEQLAIADIQQAADGMHALYVETQKLDGYISLEVSPYLAEDTAGTIAEAQRLWKAVNRENLMVKVPATPAGIPAVDALIAEGININVTLLFAKEAYEQVAFAYISGLEKFAATGGDVSKVASVASFFVSRIDSAVDAKLSASLKQTSDPTLQAALSNSLGKVAIANAKVTYQLYKAIYSSERWQRLAALGAQPQRLLWASTGTKNPQYRDVLYVEELIGAQTVNTIPPATFDAFRDHGQVRNSLEEEVESAQAIMAGLSGLGIALSHITDQLLVEGVQLFADAFDKLLATVEAKREAVLGENLDRLTYTLPPELAAKVEASLEAWRSSGKVRRLWQRDASLWSGADENQWLGWLGITEDQLAHIDHLKSLAEEIKASGFKQVLLLGMGGSSLGPEVLWTTFGKAEGFPELLVLDSTDPAQIATFEQKIDLGNTLFIVSSKSGGTLEPNIFKQYFYERVLSVVGAEEVGKRFIAVTDPGSKMQKVAEASHFRHIYFGLASIGGRYSVLSDFGLVPAAVIGMDVPRFLDAAEVMVHSCAASVPPAANPGVLLGTILGVLAQEGKDKLTLITSPGISNLGAWLEQLIAESTGKEGYGIIPVDLEPLAPPDRYGDDRLFVYVRLEASSDPEQDAAVAALETAGQPVVRIIMAHIYELGQEFFRWEIATAVAGAILGIHAFNQPDVEASKIVTRELTEAFEKNGSLPAESPIFAEGGIELYTDATNAKALAETVGSEPTLTGYLRAHLNRLGTGDYFALLAYIEMNAPHKKMLQAIRTAVRDHKGSATCLGFGPRFLHSTGQAYKGGPNSGVFLQLTCDDPMDIAVPEQKYSFGVVKAAQARGDFAVLAERGRRALRIHLKDLESGLELLQGAVLKALT